MQLYETRIASLQRAVAFFVMFHELGLRVQRFWSSVSCGLLRYRMDRTHSIMRIATTASPVSGADVRERIADLSLEKEFSLFARVLVTAAREWHKRKAARILHNATMALKLTSIDSSPAKSLGISKQPTTQQSTVQESTSSKRSSTTSVVDQDMIEQELVGWQLPLGVQA
jgi:hypothetical protein